MRAAIIALLVIPALVLCAGCATGIRMDAEEAAACKAQGCTAWTDAELQRLIRAAAMEGYRQGRAARGVDL